MRMGRVANEREFMSPLKRRFMPQPKQVNPSLL
jgi:hypothetical protein